MLLSFLSTIVAVLGLYTVQAVPFQDGRTIHPRDSGWDSKSAPFPPARRDSTTFSYRAAAANGNVIIADPYNYLQSSSSKDVQTFIDQQTAFFKTYTKNNFKDLDSIRASIKEADHYDEL